MNSLPAQTLANIPGVLGYYPHQSIIFVTFRHHRDDTHSRWALGPTLRINIDSLDVLPEVGEVLTAEHADVVLAFIIGRFPTQDGTTLDEITTTLAQAADTHIVPIDACWHAITITNNGTYQLCFEQTPSLTDQGIPTTGWHHGHIADIPTAQATQQLLADGDLPELTRDDCFTAFEYENGNTRTLVHQPVRFAEQGKPVYTRGRFPGEDGPEILRQHGYSQERIDKMLADGSLYVWSE